MQTTLFQTALLALSASEALAAVAPPKASHNHTDEWMADLEAQFAQRNEHLYVHLIPHSHDDVGWLKTPDEYFTGSAQNIQTANVGNIISTYVMELLADEKKRFTQVEMKFFSMWWETQTDSMKDKVRGLVKDGRLEFVNAGWSMHDEACTHHDDMMNNMIIGHEFVEREFGAYARPHVGWHIDPFGHSSANPRLFAEMGFDSWFFARIDYEDKAVRMDNQSMQWVWKPFSESLGDNVSIFTHCMPDHYHQPADFRYDENNWNTDPVVTNKNYSDFNADEKMESLRSYILDDATHFKTNRLMIPWGDDFWFSNAHVTFANLENTINYFNAKYDDITLLYSTPSEYINALKEQTTVEWPVRYDDMFPYADQNEDYWTGYFTSRADSKKQDRQTASNFHASNKVYAEKVLQKDVSDETVQAIKDQKHSMMDALGIMQHHDAITGTAKQAVADRYAQLLDNAMSGNNVLYAELVDEKAAAAGLDDSLNWSACTLSSTTPVDCSLDAISGQTFMITAHNPSTVTQEMLRFSAPATGAYKAYVMGADQQSWTSVPSDLLCYQATTDDSQATQFDACELFIKSEVAAHDFSFLKIETVTSEIEGASNAVSKSVDTSIVNEKMMLQYLEQDSTDRALFRFNDNETGDAHDLAFSLMYYNPSTGNEDYANSDNCASGAYIFKPKEGDTDKKAYSTFLKTETFKGEQTGVQAFAVYYTNSDTQEMYTTLIRLLPGASTVEWEVQMHGIPLGGSFGQTGKEVVVNWDILTDTFDNQQTFYTDSNGLEMQKRVVDYRPDFTLVTDEFASSNYYPINSAVAIRSPSTNMQLTVMNDRSQGGSVLTNGSIEIMQNRRLMHDDWRGVGEPLDETNSSGEGIQVNTRYFVQLFDMTTTSSMQREIQLVVDEPITYFVAKAESTSLFSSKTSDARKALPSFDGDLKVHLLPMDRNQILIRIENMADLFDGAASEETPMFDLQSYAMDLWSSNNSGSTAVDVHIIERSLSDSMDYAEMVKEKFQWPTESGPAPVAYPADQEPNAIVALQPQRIRLFRVSYQPHAEQAQFLE